MTKKSICKCETPNLIVVDWVEFVDNDGSYRDLTIFRPMVQSTARSRALTLMCSHCGVIIPADMFLDAANTNLGHTRKDDVQS